MGWVMFVLALVVLVYSVRKCLEIMEKDFSGK